MRESARGESCAMRLPAVCNHNNETVVLAHLPCVDKGKGYKSPDWWGVYACSACHDEIDRRTHVYDQRGSDLERWIMDALYETLKRVIAKGLIVIR